jgi:hypothetical protein
MRRRLFCRPPKKRAAVCFRERVQIWPWSDASNTPSTWPVVKDGMESLPDVGLPDVTDGVDLGLPDVLWSSSDTSSDTFLEDFGAGAVDTGGWACVSCAYSNKFSEDPVQKCAICETPAHLAPTPTEPTGPTVLAEPATAAAAPAPPNYRNVPSNSAVGTSTAGVDVYVDATVEVRALRSISSSRLCRDSPLPSQPLRYDCRARLASEPTTTGQRR